MKTNDEFFQAVGENMGPLQMLYHKFADNRPVMEIVLPAGRISAYPCSEFLSTLSPRSQRMLRQEYRAANKENKMVVFVRDEQEQVLKSATFPIEEIEQAT